MGILGVVVSTHPEVSWTWEVWIWEAEGLGKLWCWRSHSRLSSPLRKISENLLRGQSRFGRGSKCSCTGHGREDGGCRIYHGQPPYQTQWRASCLPKPTLWSKIVHARSWRQGGLNKTALPTCRNLTNRAAGSPRNSQPRVPGWPGRWEVEGEPGQRLWCSRCGRWQRHPFL